MEEKEGGEGSRATATGQGDLVLGLPVDQQRREHCSSREEQMLKTL